MFSCLSKLIFVVGVLVVCCFSNVASDVGVDIPKRVSIFAQDKEKTETPQGVGLSCGEKTRQAFGCST